VPMDVPWPDAPAPGSFVRLAVRVLLVDQEDRVLLFRYSADDGERFWCTPGGGIDPNESPCDAARREVFEERGWEGALSLMEVWHRRHVATFLGQLIDHRERWYLARVPAFRVNPSGFTELERQTISGWMWWGLDALAQAPERLVPEDLAQRLRQLLVEGIPQEPVHIGP
jgi:8-oxo-dGTP pyrophosphatase MutT (NUDIX family)